jgi:Fe-S-cluster containining protein
MESLSASCKRCGKCCLSNVVAYITEEDLSRWHREGRQDILTVIEHGHVIWVGDHMISADDGHYAHGCPFLLAENNRWLCSIYETRPLVCRAYQPGSSALCSQWANHKTC